MNPADKATFNAKLLMIQGLLSGQTGRGAAGASSPITTPAGPGIAPGLMPLGLALDADTQALLNLVDLLRDLIAKL